MINEEELKSIVNEVRISVRKNNNDPESLGREIQTALLQIVSRHPDKGSGDESRAFKMYFER